ncbi:FtsK/SpoIIIE domain-containing protein [uncultured Leifsonia sp.]|uniref:FtsK/SpoIIIE domain-containing protein n=1 Tax=uncultured Leifsonia sp. TaxID=340359 RepID=UPI0028D10A67|nr:FtsK/SpoIIIE domain-containing protein [uncultured Leifsonia sp.]
MKVRVSVIGYAGAARARDATLTFDATATVGDVARVLVRGGAGDPRLLPLAVERFAPLTLRVRYPDGSALILDAGDAAAESGLIAGVEVEPVAEASPGPGERVKRAVGTVTVLTGAQEGVQFLLVGAETGVGRDRGNRIELLDPEVSRRHAVLRRVGDALLVEDLGSANGTAIVRADGSEHQQQLIRVTGGAVVAFGPVRVRIDVGPPPGTEARAPSAARYLQSPRVDPVFVPEPLELPAPPDAQEPARFPLIAMAAPLLMGAVLYVTTKSLLSLLFVGLSPLIMVGSWLDNRLTKRKAARARLQEFEDGLAAAEDELKANLTEEQAARDAETPSADALTDLPASRDPRLWSRRPEHRAFLEVRLGAATLESRKVVQLPARGNIPADQWHQLTRLHERFRVVPGVPLLERLERCGSLGVAGERFWSDAAARAVLIQLLALHSPADLVFTAFALPEQADDEWSWVKWLPHVDSAYSPIAVPHLAADDSSASILLTALEGLIAQRATVSWSSGVRSRIAGDAAAAAERLAPAEGRPHVPAVVVLVLTDTIADLTRLVGVAEDGADAGVHVIWVAPELGGIPAACRTVIEARPDGGRVHLVRNGRLTALSSADTVGLPATMTFARGLAAVVDAGARILDESDLPRNVALARLVPDDIVGSSETIVSAWRRSGSLVSEWAAGIEREPVRLTAVVGQGGDGPVSIDLGSHGPHALVGGTTGSGKSEFLQTWILSLAAGISPDRLTFLLVDYKGGAAFADCVGLPHTVGLVTDLNAHLVRRALTSLRAELRYREELLAEKGAKDIVTLERRGDPDAPPSLVIVIDEFAALVGDIPEFVDGVIDVGQRGRSLGLHLIMATQRPAGVITDNLRANTNLRVALRMADEADSSDVIGAPDAAHFPPEAPGRAAIKIGAGRLTQVQAGYVGGRADSEHRESVDVSDLGFGEQPPWPVRPESDRGRGRLTGPRDIEAVAANIRRAAAEAGTRTPRRPWVDQLPAVLPLASPLLAASAAPSSGIVVGLVDEPDRQRRSPHVIRLSEAGNVAVFGAPGTGKTTALLTMTAATVATNAQTRVYGIDGAGGHLGTLGVLPNTGDIVPGEDRDRVVRLLRLIKSLIAERSAARDAGPPVLLLLDGLAAFRDAYELRGGGADPFGDLVEIAGGGRNAGVHVLLSAERTSALSAALGASVPERLALRQTAESDYQYLGVAGDALKDAGPGRAVRIGSDEEIQIAVPGAGADPADTDAALVALAAAQRARGTAAPADVPAVPAVLPRSALASTDRAPAPFAVDTIDLAPVTAPEHGFLLVTGPAGSGRTTAIRSLLEALQERPGGRPIDAVLIAPRRSTLRDLRIWSEVADTGNARHATIGRLVRALGGTTSVPTTALPTSALGLIGGASGTGEEVPVSPGAAGFPAAGRRGIVVVEDIGGFDGSGDERALAALLKLLRRSEHTSIVEGENATLGAVWELAGPLRGARWALALQPDANDAPSLFTTSFAHAARADYPPGRGFLIENGRLTGIHVALPDPL